MEAADYNPVEHRSPDQLTTSSFAVFMHLLKASAGSGILFLPYAFKTTGYLASIICSIIVGAICIHTAVLMVRCSQILCVRSHSPALSLAGTAEVAFRRGPKPLQKFAGAFATLANITVCFIQYQTAVVYMLYVVTSFKQLIEHLTGQSEDLRLYILGFLPIFCLFALAPDFDFLTPFSVLGTLFLSSGLLVSCYYFLSDFQSPSRLPAIADLDQLGVYCSVFIFSLYNMSILMPLENSMRQPSSMPALLAIGMLINVAVNTVFGFLGYNKYEDACDTVIKNLPLGELLAQTVKITVSLSVLFTFGLQYLVPLKILWPMIADRIGDKMIYELCFRLIGVIICALIAIILPHLVHLLALLSAINMTTLMILIPVIIETSIKWNDLGRIKHICLMIKNSFIFVVGLAIMFFGARESIRGMLHESASPDPEVCQ